jgi:amidohydrolase
MIATGQILSALQTIVSRNVDPQETAVLTIGSVHGGTAYNVIAETVALEGTIRTFSPAVRETVLTRLRVLLDGIAAGMGARYELKVQDVAPAVVNDPGVSEVARAAAVQVVGATSVAWHPPLMVSEDFSEYQRLMPACYMLLGSGNPALGLDAPHHNPRFDFDERPYRSARRYGDAAHSSRGHFNRGLRIPEASGVQRRPVIWAGLWYNVFTAGKALDPPL